MKKVLGTALAAAALIAASSITASAATTTYAPGATHGLDADSNFGNSVRGSFTNYFTFTVPAGGESVAASLSSSAINLLVSTFNILKGTSNSTLTNFTSAGVAVDGTVSKNGRQTQGFAPVDPNALQFLTAGIYAINVTGTTVKSGNNFLSANFSGTLNVAAVPLPTSVALFGVALAGLGVAGAMRRKGLKADASAA